MKIHWQEPVEEKYTIELTRIEAEILNHLANRVVTSNDNPEVNIFISNLARSLPQHKLDYFHGVLQMFPKY